VINLGHKPLVSSTAGGGDITGVVSVSHEEPLPLSAMDLRRLIVNALRMPRSRVEARQRRDCAGRPRTKPEISVRFGVMGDEASGKWGDADAQQGIANDTVTGITTANQAETAPGPDGRRCPDCHVAPGVDHLPDCPRGPGTWEG